MPNIVLPPDYKPTPDEEYMSELQLEYFRQKLITWKEELLKFELFVLPKADLRLSVGNGVRALYPFR